MGKRPKLENLELYFEKGKPFSLTDAQYEARTGLELPKDKYYLLNNSALAKNCKEKGWKIRLQEKIVFFEKCQEENMIESYVPIAAFLGIEKPTDIVIIIGFILIIVGIMSSGKKK